MTTFANGESALSIRNKINAAISAIDRIDGYYEIVSAGTTTTIDNTYPSKIRVTGSSAHTIVLPDVTTLSLGWYYIITNDSSTSITVQSSGLNTIATIPANTSNMIQCVLLTGTTAASWINDVTSFSAATGTGNVVRSANPTLTGTVNAANLNITAEFRMNTDPGTAGQILLSGGTGVVPDWSSNLDGVAIGNTTPSTVKGSLLSSTSVITDGFATRANGTLALAFASNGVVQVTPTATGTFTTTVPPAGTRCTLIILTSGTTGYTMTFGTGFKTTGTLATGTVTARYFVMEFISDGTNLIESSRTVAIA